ncbi:MAG: hypothetical protein HDS42_07345 [Bacteroides sp.]|nr:hypothetical protein [Bacteroides sp.]
MSVDIFYYNVSLGVPPDVRESLKKKFITVFPEIGDTSLINFDSFDENDEYWDQFD